MGTSASCREIDRQVYQADTRFRRLWIVSLGHEARIKDVRREFTGA
jgi:hypothetical protein